MKTREQIRLELEQCNPTTNIGGVIYGPGDAPYEAVMEQWIDAMLEQMNAPAAYKIWPNVQAFMAAFTMPEKAQIALSTDPTIAALRLELTTWLSDVHSDDSRVVLGLDKLVELGILTTERKNAILL